MALLIAADELRVWRGLMRLWSRPETKEVVAFDKNVLLAAIQANNIYMAGAATARPATSINANFPAAFQSAATTGQKGQLVAAVTLAQTGNTNLLRQVLGEVD